MRSIYSNTWYFLVLVTLGDETLLWNYLCCDSWLYCDSWFSRVVYVIIVINNFVRDFWKQNEDKYLKWFICETLACNVPYANQRSPGMYAYMCVCVCVYKNDNHQIASFTPSFISYFLNENHNFIFPLLYLKLIHSSNFH